MKVAVITTSRADWNSLGMVAKELERRIGGRLTVLCVSDHAAGGDVLAEFPTARWLELAGDRPGYRAAELLEALQSALEAVDPDMVVICGDRYETLQAAFCASLMGIPVAHLAGGDVSGGSTDEKYRHAITKLADVHFPTHREAAERIIQMGEDPHRVHSCGSASVDRVIQTPIMPLAETTKLLGLPDSRPFILLNWQPETPRDSGLPELLDALVINPMPVVCVGINPDPGSDAAGQLLAAVVRKPNSRLSTWVGKQNLPPELYLSALAHCACLIGNSSSGFYEAPHYGTAVINVGNRQRGRGPTPACMVHVEADASKITTVLKILNSDPEFREVPQFLFGDGHAAPQIADAILSYEGVHIGGKLFRDHQSGGYLP